MNAPLGYALIGVGNLGAPMAERLLEQAFDLTVCDKDPMRLQSLRDKGAKTAQSATQCANHDVVLVLVATATQLRAVVDEIASARASGAKPGRFVVMSTVPADAVRHAATVLSPLGMMVVDAPVSGGAARARAGELTIMAGGDAADVAVLAPLFDALATHSFHCGPLGAGQSVKIVNNILCHATSTLMGEALRLGMSQGLAPEIMAQVMEVSTGRNWLTAKPGLVAQVLGDQSTDRRTFDGILAILQKDMVIAADLAAADPAAYPMIAGVAQLIGDLGDETFETWQSVSAADGTRA